MLLSVTAPKLSLERTILKVRDQENERKLKGISNVIDSRTNQSELTKISMKSNNLIDT